MMDVQGKSDLPIVPRNRRTTPPMAAAETGEGRGGAKGNAVQGGTRRTQGWESMSLALDRIRDAARRTGREVYRAPHHLRSIAALCGFFS